MNYDVVRQEMTQMLSIKNAAEPRQSWTVAHGILSAVPQLPRRIPFTSWWQKLARNWPYVARCFFCDYRFFAGSDGGLLDSDPRRSSVSLGHLSGRTSLDHPLAAFRRRPMLSTSGWASCRYRPANECQIRQSPMKVS